MHRRTRVTPILVELLVVAAPLLACTGKDTPADAPSTVGADDGESGADPDDDTDDDAPPDDSATSDTPASSTGEDDEADTTDGKPFIQDPDGGGAAIECDVWVQDCPDDQKCMPWVDDGGQIWNATKCVDVAANPAQVGDPCTAEGGGGTGLDDCAEGAMCWHVDPDTNMGTCIEFCQGSAASPVCTDTHTSCNIVNDGVLILCLPNCHPLLQDCAPGEACYPTPAGYNCAPDYSGEDGLPGDPCGAINDCDSGNFCQDASEVAGCVSEACCAEFCDINAPANECSGSGQECLSPFDGSPPPGLEDVGECGLP